MSCWCGGQRTCSSGISAVWRINRPSFRVIRPRSTGFAKCLQERVGRIVQGHLYVAVKMKAICPSEFERVIIDWTVIEKALEYPTDSGLLEIALYQLVKGVKQFGIKFK